MKKYKLINNKTKEEHLCDKVTIDGFDYYVNGEKIIHGNYFITDDERLEKSAPDWNAREWHKKVIATNNPNIDLPKVLDKVENIAYEWLYDDETETKASQGYPLKPMEYGFIKGYNKSQETHPFSEEDMIEFADWEASSDGAAKFWRENRINLRMEGSGDKHKELLRKLLQLWKEQQPKKVYYE